MNGRISKNVAKELRTNENLLLILVDKSLNMKPAKVWTFESTFIMLDKKQHITSSSIFFALYQNCLKRINNRPWSNVKDLANTEEIVPKVINDHCHWRIRILGESKDFIWCTKQMHHFLIRLVEIWKLIVVETYSEGKWKKSLLNVTSPRNKSYTFSVKRRVFGNSNSR